AAAHTRTGLVGPGLAGFGVVVVVVVDDERLAWSGFGDGPAGGMEASVVEAAQQDQVLSDSGPAVGPVPDVVSLGPLHRAPAPGPSTPSRLLELELPAQRSVGQAQRPSEFDVSCSKDLGHGSRNGLVSGGAGVVVGQDLGRSPVPKRRM